MINRIMQLRRISTLKILFEPPKEAKEIIMKKHTIAMLFGIILSSILTICLTSCAIVNGVDSLWKKIDTAMNGLESYEITTTLDMTFYMDEVKYSARGTSQVLNIGNGKSDFFYFNDTKTTVSADQADKGDTVRTLIGYKDGECYLSTTVGTVSYQKVRSAMTTDEFAEYLESESVDVNGLLDCRTVNQTQNQDGSRSLHLSEYTDERLDSFCMAFGLYELSEDINMSDMSVTLNINEAYLITDIKIEPVFEADANGNTATLAIEMEYKNYNAVRSAAAKLKAENYVEIADINLLSELQDMTDALADKENGSFVLSTKHTTKILGQNNSSTETDNVTYGKNDNGFFYDISAKYNGVNVVISYSNGKQTVKTGSDTAENDQSDEEAKRYIKQLARSHGYDKTCVENITEIDSGVYEIQLSVRNISAYEQIFNSVGGKLSDKKITNIMTVTVKDGNIVKIEGSIRARGSISSGKSTYEILLAIENAVTYK